MTNNDFLAAFRNFEMSSVTRVIDVDTTGNRSTWFVVSLLNANCTTPDGLPMTVEMTFRHADLKSFCNVMLWDMTEMVNEARNRYQGAGIEIFPGEYIDAPFDE